jgi:hypothetical protein
VLEGLEGYTAALFKSLNVPVRTMPTFERAVLGSTHGVNYTCSRVWPGPAYDISKWHWPSNVAVTVDPKGERILHFTNTYTDLLFSPLDPEFVHQERQRAEAEAAKQHRLNPKTPRR